MKTKWDALIKKYDSAYQEELKALLWSVREIEKAHENKASLAEQEADSWRNLSDRQYLYSGDLAFDGEFRSSVAELKARLDFAIADLREDEAKLKSRVAECARLLKKYEFLRERELLGYEVAREIQEADELEDWVMNARSG
jgi:predicted aminopeptidase